jgi:hypothetical protein
MIKIQSDSNLKKQLSDLLLCRVFRGGKELSQLMHNPFPHGVSMGMVLKLHFFTQVDIWPFRYMFDDLVFVKEARLLILFLFGFLFPLIRLFPMLAYDNLGRLFFLLLHHWTLGSVVDLRSLYFCMVVGVE